mmetsp:Transcript_33321/g.73419  ORF Transcript_33321/g.73419 Transcript_33321/m.73419 type:complete len:136 (-) Transcript_33321:289-696(-)
MGLLNGTETDPDQMTSLEKNMRDGVTVKVSLTCYSKGGKPYLDLIASRGAVVLDPILIMNTKASINTRASMMLGGSRSSFMVKARPQVFSVQVHCPATKLGTAEDLGRVDELLAILTQVCAPPPQDGFGLGLSIR